MACTQIKLDERHAHLAANHPCLGGARDKGRLHLPVSPRCNIGCRFCTRSVGALELQRPGMARQILPVDRAVEVVGRAVKLCPELSVVGGAGPGDALASPHALKCFRAVNDAFPHLIGCLSTNGLMLPECADDIVKAGVRSVTVTVNAVNPYIWERIVGHIVLDGKRHTGVEAGMMHILRQFQGIRALSERGVLVKINTVLIPGVNDHHIGKIAEVAAGLGASLINIIPLIPQGEFAGAEEPGCDMLCAAREAAEEYLPVFRHCQHCRADACGRLGGADLSAELYGALRCENTFSHG